MLADWLSAVAKLAPEKVTSNVSIFGEIFLPIYSIGIQLIAWCGEKESESIIWVLPGCLRVINYPR